MTFLLDLLDEESEGVGGGDPWVAPAPDHVACGGVSSRSR